MWLSSGLHYHNMTTPTNLGLFQVLEEGQFFWQEEQQCTPTGTSPGSTPHPVDVLLQHTRTQAPLTTV